MVAGRPASRRATASPAALYSGAQLRASQVDVTVMRQERVKAVYSAQERPEVRVAHKLKRAAELLLHLLVCGLHRCDAKHGLIATS